jgi:hypothetical protein
MNSITQQLLRRKQQSASTFESTRFFLAVLNNAHALRKWQLKMQASMSNYVSKVTGSIEQIFNEGARVIVISNHPRMHNLMKKLVAEKDRCDLALR